jgi:fatty acid desaturase
MPESRESSSLCLREARRVVADLFVLRPHVYWRDFLSAIALGHVCFALTRLLYEHPLDPLAASIAVQAVLFAVTCALYYRAAMFVHEIAHLPRRKLRAFRRVWNLLCGIPFFVPAFTYESHRDHHRRQSFGTAEDGEYLPLARMTPWTLALYFSQCLWTPPLAVVRFGLLSPLGWIYPPLGRWLYRRASSLVIDPGYKRESPTPGQLRAMHLQEAGCVAFLLWMFLGQWLVLGRSPLTFLIHAYATGIVVVLLNAIRTLATHRWAGDGQESTTTEQLLDSVIIDSDSVLTVVLHPLGLRYHATHHLFPGIPYHNLRAAHQRLMAELPADSPYRHTVEKSIWKVIGDLRRQMHAQAKTESAELGVRVASLESARS